MKKRAGIAFITTCKSRLKHVQQTLPTLIAEDPYEIILVDYGCPQSTGDWVESVYPMVKVVRVNDDPGFCAARARNIGARHSTAEWLCFIDADICVVPGFLLWLSENLKSNNFYRASPVQGERDQETWGTCICSREIFDKVGGYDEAFRGWGGEDDELYVRFAMERFVESEYPSGYINVIRHDDNIRTLFYDIKKKEHHWFVNQFYTTAKLDIVKIRNKPLSLRERHVLMNDIRAAVTRWFDDNSVLPFTFTVTFEQAAWLPENHRLNRKYTFTYEAQEGDGSSVIG